ncbi:hypothetical protein E3N88_00845 [Mikania micrantha]|uniref:Uncharacterized protein n=1 Tax=Mikania micrantha TaxID=192012 RepID=A0A5N6PZA9_9ASTR|nr:hypothetical protein E3N88_00845 [Mikania micrantha]
MTALSEKGIDGNIGEDFRPDGSAETRWKIIYVIVDGFCVSHKRFCVNQTRGGRRTTDLCDREEVRCVQ